MKYLPPVNYLAHLLLSNNEPGVRIGNFAGDLFKGRQWEEAPVDIGRGILLHRFIDTHADEHPVNAELRRVLPPYFGKWAGVALDMYYDHILAGGWAEHSDLTLVEFLEDCDADFEARKGDTPARAYNRWRVIYGHRFMHHYADPEGIARVFDGMKGRIPHDTGFEASRKVLGRERDVIARGFHSYFPQLKLAAREHLRKLADNENREDEGHQ